MKRKKEKEERKRTIGQREKKNKKLILTLNFHSYKSKIYIIYDNLKSHSLFLSLPQKSKFNLYLCISCFA